MTLSFNYHKKKWTDSQQLAKSESRFLLWYLIPDQIQIWPTKSWYLISDPEEIWVNPDQVQSDPLRIWVLTKWKSSAEEILFTFWLCLDQIQKKFWSWSSGNQVQKRSRSNSDWIQIRSRRDLGWSGSDLFRSRRDSGLNHANIRSRKDQSQILFKSGSDPEEIWVDPDQILSDPAEISVRIVWRSDPEKIQVKFWSNPDQIQKRFGSIQIRSGQTQKKFWS